MRLVPLFFCGMLAACAPTMPRSVSGTLPKSGSYSVVAAETLAPAAQAALAHALGDRGMVSAPDGQQPDRLILLTLADRPLFNGSYAGEKAPVDRKAPGWIDRPQKSAFGGRRREIRLTIRFLSHDGKLREERSAVEIVPRKAPPPDLSRLIEAALKS